MIEETWKESLEKLKTGNVEHKGVRHRLDIVKAYYKRICEYMEFNDQGMVIGKGCRTPSMTKNSRYMKQAYELEKCI